VRKKPPLESLQAHSAITRKASRTRQWHGNLAGPARRRVLEYIAPPNARGVLEVLAGGAPEGRLTREARLPWSAFPANRGTTTEAPHAPVGSATKDDCHKYRSA